MVFPIIMQMPLITYQVYCHVTLYVKTNKIYVIYVDRKGPDPGWRMWSIPPYQSRLGGVEV